MAPLKAIATWYPPDRQASYSGWMMVAGGLGALAATVPLEFALHFTHWRMVFVGLAMVTLGAGLAILWRVPDIAKPAQSGGIGAQFATVRTVLLHPRFWWIAPLAGLGMGAFMAVQGLWAVPWLMEVSGVTRAAAANHLLAMNAVIIAGYAAIGFFGTSLARRDIHSRHLFAAGFGLNCAALAIILLEVPGSYLWWSLYGLGACVNVLGFTVLNEGFARDIAGRANTALNLVMFGGSFLTQWGIGVVVDLMRTAFGFGNASGLRIAFAAILLGDAAAFAWFAYGWKRHRLHVPIRAAA